MPRTGENIYKRKDGRWEGRYIKGRFNSKTCYGYVYGKSYKEVKTKLMKIQSAEEISQPLPAAPSKYNDTFLNVANAWMENSRPLLKESTQVKYKNMLRSYIIPELGNYAVSEITNDMILDFSNKLLTVGGAKGEGLLAKTVSDILSVLRSIQKYAFNKNMVVNFSIHCVHIKQNSGQLRILSIQEQQVLYNYLNADLTLCHLGILLCLFTGLRIGELCALKWEDICFDEKTMYIHRTMQRLQVDSCDSKKTRVVISTPKSSCSIRTVPLPEIIMDQITLMRRPPHSYFLTGDRDRFIEPRTMQNRFKIILKQCGIDDANFHVLRHTFATRCVEVGFDIKSLSEILGHANVNITLNRYVHPTLELKRENMSKLNLFAVK